MKHQINEIYANELDKFSKFLKNIDVKNVLETGVNIGYSSKMFLETIPGNLYSLERYPKSSVVVPYKLWNRWYYRICNSVDIMPELLEKHKIDLFHHDSLHTYEHMLAEYYLAAKYRVKYISSHDIITRCNAWDHFINNSEYNEVFRYRRIGVARHAA